MSYEWFVHSSNSAPDEASIQAFLNESGSVQSIRLNKNNVTIGYKYEFSCKITNFLGISGRAKIEVRRQNKDIPNLKVVGPDRTTRDLAIRLEGKETLSIYSLETISEYEYK